MPTINRKQVTVPKVKYKDQSHTFYNTKAWVELRDKYIHQQPLCEECLKHGIVKPAEEVHHIVKFLSGKTDSERWKLLLSEDNLMSLCKDCHIEIHRHDRGTGD